MGEHDRRACSNPGRDWSSGDKRLQHGDGVGHHGGGAPRYQELKATSRVFSLLVGKARNLPAIVAGEVGLSGFPRLKKLTATGTITTARLWGLAVRVDLGFPNDTDLPETASVDWVWSLAMLSRGITLKAIGWLQNAHAVSPAEWGAAVQALGADERFTVKYIA